MITTLLCYYRIHLRGLCDSSTLLIQPGKRSREQHDNFYPNKLLTDPSHTCEYLHLSGIKHRYRTCVLLSKYGTAQDSDDSGSEFRSGLRQHPLRTLAFHAPRRPSPKHQRDGRHLLMYSRTSFIANMSRNYDFDTTHDCRRADIIHATHTRGIGQSCRDTRAGRACSNPST